MRARVYDNITGLTLFSLDITEQNDGNFEQFLEANGFEYIKHRDVWANKRQGYECVIYKN